MDSSSIVPLSDWHVRTGAQFRLARVRAGKTLRRAAEELGCTVNRLRWHEAGGRSIRVDDLCRAAALFRVPPSTLLVAWDDREAA